jgi:hypothetical protein
MYHLSRLPTPTAHQAMSIKTMGYKVGSTLNDDTILSYMQLDTNTGDTFHAIYWQRVTECVYTGG